MQIKVPPGNSDALLEAREQRLMAFTADGIERLSEAGTYAGRGTILAVARSVDSPAARALIALRSVLADHRVTVRLVIAEDDAPLEPFIGDSTGQSAGSAFEVRIARDHRLRDAHEQLIVGRASVWFGDSLRRDIHRRDLFEQFLADVPEVARAAAHAFEQLWLRTEPCHALPALAADSLTAAPGRKTGNTGPTGTVLC
ncbi:MAG TPA: hypothetical protein VNZ50_13620 [Hyphomicrobiaceae bacterium]|nr:hypothetical protein [Hyphomicrobiaceae bacterium]